MGRRQSGQCYCPLAGSVGALGCGPCRCADNSLASLGLRVAAVCARMRVSIYVCLYVWMYPCA